MGNGCAVSGHGAQRVFIKPAVPILKTLGISEEGFGKESQICPNVVAWAN